MSFKKQLHLEIVQTRLHIKVLPDVKKRVDRRRKKDRRNSRRKSKYGKMVEETETRVSDRATIQIECGCTALHLVPVQMFDLHFSGGPSVLSALFPVGPSVQAHNTHLLLPAASGLLLGPLFTSARPRCCLIYLVKTQKSVFAVEEFHQHSTFLELILSEPLQFAQTTQEFQLQWQGWCMQLYAVFFRSLPCALDLWG